MQRFKFGKNWSRFLLKIDQKHIDNAHQSVKTLLNCESLNDKSFIDVGSGSGLFSLSARKLGASVFSFDYDSDSVKCTEFLKEKHFKEDLNWTIQQGSILDQDYIQSLGQFDIVYSWGVLHHTGNMMQAFENIQQLVKQNGKLVISIYNDQEGTSRRWKKLKKFYYRLPSFLKPILAFLVFIKFWGKNCFLDFLKCGNPFKGWNGYVKTRGMSPWYDIVDWVGGYPFEVAKPEVIFDYFKKNNFELISLKTCNGLACNEFVFKKCKNTSHL